MKKVVVGTSIFRHPGKLRVLPLETVRDASFEVLNRPTGGGLSFRERAAVADDGAVLTTGMSSKATLWQLASASVELDSASSSAPVAVFARDEKTCVLVGAHVRAFDRAGTLVTEVRSPPEKESTASYAPIAFLRDGRMIAARYEGSAGELVLDVLGQSSTFSGKLRHVSSCDVDEERDLLVTFHSKETRTATSGALQLWSISRRALVGTVELADFPRGVSSVAIVAVGDSVRIALVVASCLFVTDREGTIHHASQLDGARTILRLPGGRIAVDGLPPVVFDVAKNEWVGQVELSGWPTKQLWVRGLAPTTRAIIADADGRLGLVDFATSRQWSPIPGPKRTHIVDFAASRSGRYVASSGSTPPLVLRAPPTS